MYKKQTLPFPISRRLLCYGGKQGYCILCNNHEMQLLHILRQFKSIKSTLVNKNHLLGAFR